MAMSLYNPNKPTVEEMANYDPSQVNFQAAREGNPMVEGYAGYQGFGVSPYSFSFGPYGFGSYGYEPGDADWGFANPKPEKEFDTVGLRRK